MVQLSPDQWDTLMGTPAPAAEPYAPYGYDEWGNPLPAPAPPPIPSAIQTTAPVAAQAQDTYQQALDVAFNWTPSAYTLPEQGYQGLATGQQTYTPPADPTQQFLPPESLLPYQYGQAQNAANMEADPSFNWAPAPDLQALSSQWGENAYLVDEWRKLQEIIPQGGIGQPIGAAGRDLFGKALSADIPVVSPFLRNVVEPAAAWAAANDPVGGTIGRELYNLLPGGDLSRQQYGEAAANFVVPNSALDVALTAAPVAGKALRGLPRGLGATLGPQGQADDVLGKVLAKGAGDESTLADLLQQSTDALKANPQAAKQAFVQNADAAVPKRWDVSQGVGDLPIGARPAPVRKAVAQAAETVPTNIYDEATALVRKGDMAGAKALIPDLPADKASALVKIEWDKAFAQGEQVIPPAGTVDDAARAAGSGVPPAGVPPVPPSGGVPPVPPELPPTASPESWWHNFIEAVTPERLGNELRQATAGLDFSNALRQALFTIRHGPEYLSSMKSGIRGAVDEAYAMARNAELKSGNRGELFIADLPGEAAATISKREETYAGELFSNLPGYKQTGRGNTLGLNEVRARNYDVVLNAWKRAEQAAQEGKAGPLQRLSNTLIRPNDEEALARYINRNTGRGTLGPAEGTWLSSGLGFGFFSPRYQASLVQRVANLANVQNPRVAIEAWKDIGTTVAAVTSLLALANESGLAKVNMDPRSSDFGKFKVGNTRIDPWAGYQSLATMIARVQSGEFAGGSPAPLKTVLTNFIRGKLAPLPGATFDVYEGEDITGRKMDAGNLAVSVLPISLQGLYEAAQEGLLGEALMAFPASFFGLGTNTYLDSATQMQIDGAKKLGIEGDFRDLSPVDQARVNAAIVQEGKPLEDSRRIGPFYQANEEAYTQIIASEPELQALYPTLDSFRDAVIAKVMARGVNRQDAVKVLESIEEQIGLTAAAKQTKQQIIKADPDIIDVLQRLHNAGEAKYAPTKGDKAYADAVKAALKELGQ